MQQRVDVAAGHIFRAAPDHRRCGGIDERCGPIDIDSEDALSGRLQNQLVLANESPQLLRLTLDRLAFAEQLDEDVHLRLQDFGMKRFEDVVDSAELISSEHIRFVSAEGRQKNDRRVTRFVTLANETGSLEAVQIRHLHIEKNDREFVIEQCLERGPAGLGLHEILPHIGEDRLERQKIRRLIVDQKDIDSVVRGSHASIASRHRSTRNGAISSRRKI